LFFGIFIFVFQRFHRYEAIVKTQNATQDQKSTQNEKNAHPGKK